MRSYLLLILSVLVVPSYAADKDSVFYYVLPDSIKAVSLIAEIRIESINSKKEGYAGIKTSEVSLML